MPQTRPNPSRAIQYPWTLGAAPGPRSRAYATLAAPASWTLVSLTVAPSVRKSRRSRRSGPVPGLREGNVPANCTARHRSAAVCRRPGGPSTPAPGHRTGTFCRLLRDQALGDHARGGGDHGLPRAAVPPGRGQAGDRGPDVVGVTDPGHLFLLVLRASARHADRPKYL